jgi:hypothetical protein
MFLAEELGVPPAARVWEVTFMGRQKESAGTEQKTVATSAVSEK